MHKFQNNIKPRLHFTPFQTIVFGFMAAILIGALLLFLPFSTKRGETTSFFDALFTSTSAVCVTGLVVHDTATHWSMFGQIVILLLIQIGGLGVVTMAGFLAIISGRKIGLFARNTMQEALSAHKMGGVLKLTNFILFSSFLIEVFTPGLQSAGLAFGFAGYTCIASMQNEPMVSNGNQILGYMLDQLTFRL